MKLYSSWAGIAVVGLIQVATAIPSPVKIKAFADHPDIAPYSTLAIPLENEFYAALLPNKYLRGSQFSYHLGNNQTPKLEIWAREKLTGLTLFRAPASDLEKGPGKLAICDDLTRGSTVVFSNDLREQTRGIYVGAEHMVGSLNFPLRLLRIQTPELANLSIGQPCFDTDGRLVGFILGISRKGTCHLLPAKAVQYLIDNPGEKRVRLGCLLDAHSTTPVIEGIINGGPFARAGIQTGDILVSINGKPINNYGDLLDTTYYLSGKDILDIRIIRGTQTIDIPGIIPILEER